MKTMPKAIDGGNALDALERTVGAPLTEGNLDRFQDYLKNKEPPNTLIFDGLEHKQ